MKTFRFSLDFENSKDLGEFFEELLNVVQDFEYDCKFSAGPECPLLVIRGELENLEEFFENWFGEDWRESLM